VINGMNVIDVFRGMVPLVERCREKSRPAFVDMRTYRYKGHSMSDPRKYRTKEEEDRFEALDPIDSLTSFMAGEHDFSMDDYNGMVTEVRDQVREAVAWAEASPEPPMEELYKDVYVEKWGPYTGTTPPHMLDDVEGGRS